MPADCGCVHRALRPLLRAGLCCALGLLGTPRAHGAVSDVINALRNGGCNAHTRLPPLAAETRLQAMAEHMAKGLALQQAAGEVNYQAAALSALHLTGHGRDTDLRPLLIQKYCGMLLDPRWQQMGSAGRGTEVWIVLARPHGIPDNPLATTQTVLMLVNQARAHARACGARSYAAAAPLRLNESLSKAAQLHAEDMARHGRMSHTGSDGSTPAQRLTRQGYRWKMVGENVAAGADSARSVMSGWLQSPGHCSNIMNPDFTEMGLAFAINHQDEFAVYWSQSFATPR